MLGFTLGATIMPVIAVAQQRAAVQTIPNVLGRPVKEATDSLARTNLPIVQIVVRTDTVRSGIVVAQRPPAGTPVTRVRVESLWVTSPVRRTTVDSRAVSVARATPPPSRTSDDVTSTPGNVVVNHAADSALTRVNVPGIVVRERTKVPDLFRKTPQQVAADLKRHKLRPGKESRDYSDDVAPGLVFRQHPPPGADGEVLAGTMVDVWYSVGPHPQPPSLVIPSVVGLALREAGDSLRRVGLGIGHVDRIVVPGIRDRVVEQKPVAGSGAHRGDSVDVSVGIAPRTVKVPQVTGLARSVAEDSLKAAGLGVGRVILVSVNDQAEVIVRQQPAAGAPADSGSFVDLVENRHPETRMTRVPDLTGRSTAEADSVLRGDSLILGIVRRPGESAVDRVAGQEPVPGNDVHMYSAVDVTLGVETGTALVELPDVRGLTADSARVVLVNRGFNRLSFRAGGGALTSGSVVLTQDPPGGEFANPELLVILLTGAEPPPPEPVPHLVGLDPAVARGATVVRGLQMVILDRVRRWRLTSVVMTQVPAPPLPPPPDNTVVVTLAIPIVPPVVAAITGGVLVLGAGFTARDRIRTRKQERERRRKEQERERRKDGDSSGVKLTRQVGGPEITSDQPASQGLIRASLILRLDVTEELIDGEALAGSLIKSWKPRDG
jgi:beta-lactam-binding protein with PASTA domain